MNALFNSPVFNIIRKVAGCIFSLAFIIIGIILLVNPKEYDSKAEATITKIDIVDTIVDTSGDSTDISYVYSVLVSYTANGIEYNDVELNSYSSSMKEGQKINIKYNASAPTDIAEDGFDWMPIVFIAFGVISAIVSILVPRRRAAY